ncbi:MAG: coproporphyrinogen III oxidase [Pseudopedobacter saltans]|uniref:Heme chaperone HemW n=1 Tax=Pseudopedobacter saltans TaxID=151895 RepID=A0A2W5FEQ6_9SPHI|nr:MAG: coproporphyrinogen III oxidase [Pseudopedobacter saltans]
MSSIYIHIPFCKQACNYCNFHFSTTLNTVEEMTDAIVQEIKLRQNYIEDTIESIYFGGGTPSILTIKQLEDILTKVQETFPISKDVEITLEANPDDISSEKLKEWKQLGINRFSLGVQSFFEEDLFWMNRAHNAFQAENSIKSLQDAGFHNITIDLIYGTPTLSDEKWRANVQKAIDLNIPHLSCYALTVEPGTALDKMIQKHKKENVDSEKQARHFEQLMLWSSLSGYDHYEVSNFAKPGFRSRHNSSYWQGKHYLGVGPSAHSFNGKSRQWNIANNIRYIKEINKGILPFEIEHLTPHQQLEEYIMTSLRTMEGLSLSFVEKNWNLGEAERILSESKEHIQTEKMIQKGDHLVLTDKGFLFADGIASDLF